MKKISGKTGLNAVIVAQKMFQIKIKKQALEGAEIAEKNLMSEQEQFFTGLNFL